MLLYDDEEWKVIKEFPKYSVSNYGRIKSRVKKKEKILQPNIIGRYEYVKLYKKGEHGNIKKLLRVNRIVAEYFCDNFSADKQVHHKDLNSRNNRADNLVCLTRAEHEEIHRQIRNTENKKNVVEC